MSEGPQHLHLTMEGTNPITMSEWLWVSSLSLGGNHNLENTRLLLEVLKLHSGQWICQHINYLFLHCNILELHCSSLHHIHNIVILDLDMLSWNTGFSDNSTQLWLSQCIQVAFNSRSNKSDSSFLSHTASQLAKQSVTYFASVVLSATQDCFLLNQEITPDSILKQHPEVL